MNRRIPKNPLLTETSRLETDRQNPINEIRERRTAQTAVRHRKPIRLPDYDAQEGIWINDGTVEERSIASVTFLWGRNPDFRR